MTIRKVNIIFSKCEELYIKDLKDKFDLCRDYYKNSCDVKECAKDDLLKVFDTIKSVDAIEDKINYYLPKIIERLKDLHGINDEKFWKLAVFFYFKDLVAVTYHYYNLIETVFDPSVHELNIAKSPEKPPILGIQGLVDSSFFHIFPQGIEYFVGEYFRLFYPNKYKEVAINQPDTQLNDDTQSNKDRKLTIFDKFKIKNILSYIKSKVTNYFLERVSVFICNANASERYVWKLFFISKRRVLNSNINLPLSTAAEKRRYDKNLRGKLFRPFSNKDDKYEQYLCECLRSSFPWCLAEGFNVTYINYLDFWKSIPNVNTVISEIMYQENSFSLAVAKKCGKEIIKMSHFYPLENNYSYKLNDILLNDYNKISKGGFQLKKYNGIVSGSLYPYKIKHKKKTIPLLYVSTDFYPNFLPYELSADGNGYIVSKHFSKFVNCFFDGLPDNVISSISIKMRPDHVCDPIHLKYKKGTTLLNSNVKASEYISKSKLVLVEGLSTAFFESIASNIPTVAFWPDIYYVKDDYMYYWKNLIDTGIVFNDPVALARHVENISRNPEMWWSNEEVQNVKNEFLEKHLHLNEQFEKSLIKYLSK